MVEFNKEVRYIYSVVFHYKQGYRKETPGQRIVTHVNLGGSDTMVPVDQVKLISEQSIISKTELRPVIEQTVQPVSEPVANRLVEPIAGQVIEPIVAEQIAKPKPERRVIKRTVLPKSKTKKLANKAVKLFGNIEFKIGSMVEYSGEIRYVSNVHKTGHVDLDSQYFMIPVDQIKLAKTIEPIVKPVEQVIESVVKPIIEPVIEFIEPAIEPIELEPVVIEPVAEPARREIKRTILPKSQKKSAKAKSFGDVVFRVGSMVEYKKEIRHVSNVHKTGHVDLGGPDAMVPVNKVKLIKF